MPLEWCLSRSGRPQVAGVSANSFSDPTMMQQQQLRWKHSSTQIKRIFRNHPARARVEGRMGVDRTPATLPEPQFGAVFEPLLLPNGWSAPPGAQVQVPAYPFHILRTKNKPNDAVGFLPVYSKFRYEPKGVWEILSIGEGVWVCSGMFATVDSRRACDGGRGAHSRFRLLTPHFFVLDSFFF